MDKSQSAALVRLGLLEEIFTHQTLGEFSTTRIHEMLLKDPNRWPVVRVDLDKNLIEHILTSREVDPDRARELTDADLSVPCLLLLCKDGTHCIIDGVHRISARWAKGEKFVYFWLIPIDEAPRVQRTAATIDIPWGELEVTPTGFKKRSAE